jgi:hypothetical protein
VLQEALAREREETAKTLKREKEAVRVEEKIKRERWEEEKRREIK